MLQRFKGQYGEKKGKQVFYASENKGTIKGVAKEEQVATMKRRMKKDSKGKHHT